MSEETFRVDNVVIENAPVLFGANKRKAEKWNGQLFLPGMEPFSVFDMWVFLGCYCLLDPNHPERPVRVTPTEFAELLGFARTVSEALGFNLTFPSDTYTLIRESLHRLFTVEAVFTREYKVKTGRRGAPKKRHVEYHFRCLASYAYIYDAETIPPDQLPDSRRRNVNRARTTKNEPGPPIYERIDGPRPIAIEFRISDELIRGLTRTGEHIGATILRQDIFELRKLIHQRDATTNKALLLVLRQTKKTWPVGLDNLVKRLNLTDRNVSRNRTTVLNSLRKLKGIGVVEEFSHDPRRDMVTIKKADAWHFPVIARNDDEAIDPRP